MKKWVLFIILFAIPFWAFAQDVYINEVDYDQAGSDTTEFIELVGPVNTPLDGYTVELVNGRDGSVYSTIDLSGYTIPSDVQVNGYGFFVIGSDKVANVDFTPTDFSIQNGGPDGILLRYNGTVVDGISYEGDMSTTGAADFTSGMAISIVDDGNGSIGRITLGFDANNQDQFFAQFLADPTPGDVNTPHGQTLSSDNPPNVTLQSVTPKVPEENEDMVFSVTVTDDGTISVAEIRYTINGGTENAVALSNTSGDTFEGTIPASAYNAGDELTYYIHVEDNGGNTVDLPQVTLIVGTVNISQIHNVDSDGVPVLNGKYVKVRGVATVGVGVFDSSNLSGYMEDNTGGVNIFLPGGGSVNFVENNEYNVIGKVDHYNGLTEVIPDDAADITEIGPATAVQPLEITLADLLANAEAYEGRLVLVRNVSLVSGTWPSSGSNANLTVTDDNGTTTITLRIDRDTDIDENAEPAWPQDVTAIVGQFDQSIPYTDGYQILPRRYTDFAAPQGQDAFPVINTSSITYNVFEPGVQTIYAEVTDDNALNKVELYYYVIINDTWPTSTQDTMAMTMTLASGDSFSVDVDLSNLSDGDGFVYWVEATDNAGQKSKTNPFKVLVGTTPLNKVHMHDGNGNLMYMDFLTKTSGVVTASNGLFSNSYFFFQDANAGVKVYSGGGFGSDVYLVGDSIEVIGYFDEYFDESEITGAQITVVKQGVAVQPEVVTTASIGESVEGKLITIQALDTVPNGRTAWGTNYFNLDMADDDGQIVVRIASDSLNGMPEPNWPADITGVLGMHNSAYQLLPRFVEDISTLPALGIDDDAQTISKFEVYQNYPNPFNPTTTISFNLPKVAKVRMVVFNALGQVVKNVELNGKAGINKVQFDASNLSSGIYFYQINYENRQITRKMLLVK